MKCEKTIITLLTMRIRDFSSVESFTEMGNLRRKTRSFSFMIFFNLFILITSANDIDHLALLAFKDGITDTTGELKSWNDSENLCNWVGITCQDQRVIALDLHGNNLKGTLSESIANLTFLRRLELQNNRFSGEISRKIGYLTYLQHLNLSQNSLEGSIPTEISNCSNLETLDLSGNINLKGNIPTDLGFLTKLVILNLFQNNFTGNIPSSLGNLSSLTYLSLGRNQLNGRVPDDLGRLKKLKYLRIYSNFLYGEIPRSIFNISSLHFFSVTANMFDGSFPLNIGDTLQSLENFYASENEFTGSIPESISNISTLKKWELRSNKLTGSVPQNLGRLNGLQELKLGNNLLGRGKHDLSFITDIINCTDLRILGIERNNFGGQLPESIANLSTKISMFTVGSNRISGRIPYGLGNLVALERLGLERNLFDGIIPDSLGKLTRLQDLSLLGNRLTGKIPSSLGNITELTELHLSENNLLGEIPNSLGNCKKLMVINISYTNINGSIPVEILNLPSLKKTLILAGNSLTGKLPPEIGKLIDLEELILSNNKLSGEIPDTLGKCVGLLSLRMDGNLLEGSIPQSLGSMKGLRVMDLSRNRLSGQIPKYLQNFTSLQNLNLSFNDFDGNLPTEGVFRNSTAVSITGNKKLCGGNPSFKLPVCSIEVSKKARKAVVVRVMVAIICAAVGVVILGFIFLMSINKRKHDDQRIGSNSENSHLKLTYNDLHRATNGFSASSLIGVGSHSSVYRGVLYPAEITIAIKVMNLLQPGASKSFMDECKALKNIRHRNLVQILTICSGSDSRGHEFKALVFEFMPGGSLEEWIHPKTDTKFEVTNLNVKQRLDIAIDVACALDYLHNQLEVPIVHRDLKPSNVLLDDDRIAHVGDFGLAKFLPVAALDCTKNWNSTIGLKGTIGYLAPEFGMGGRASTEGDVYSYGILLLEMFTGRRPTDEIFKGDYNLRSYVQMALPDKVADIRDPLLSSEHSRHGNATIVGIDDCLTSILRIGLLCSAESPQERMNMVHVVQELQRINDTYFGFDRRKVGKHKHKNEIMDSPGECSVTTKFL